MAPRDDSKDFYKVKRVRFFGRKDVPIICQNENGPCPLLAIANVLLLRNAIALEGSPDRPEVSTAELMSLLAARLLDVNDKSASDDEMVRQNQEQNLNDAVAVLPALATGLDVNVRFRHPLDFEFTAELAVFDLLDVTLCHAWVAGPEHAAARDAIGARSYNQLMERLVELATAEEADAEAETIPSGKHARVCDANERSERFERRTRRTRRRRRGGRGAARGAGVVSGRRGYENRPVVADQPDVARGVAALGEVVAEVAAEASDEAGSLPRRAGASSTPTETETETTRERRNRKRKRPPPRTTPASGSTRRVSGTSASQLTRAGLRDARDAVKERELAVFFRNNHFATVFKLDGALYLRHGPGVPARARRRVGDALRGGAPEAERRRGGRLRPDAAFAPFAPRAGPSVGARRGDEDDARLARRSWRPPRRPRRAEAETGTDRCPARFQTRFRRRSCGGSRGRHRGARAAPAPVTEPRRMPTTRSPWHFGRSTRRNASAKKPRRARGAEAAAATATAAAAAAAAAFGGHLLPRAVRYPRKQSPPTAANAR